MIFYGVISAETEKAVEMFVRRGDAEAMIEDVRRDDADLAESLRIEEIGPDE